MSSLNSLCNSVPSGEHILDRLSDLEARSVQAL